jgi:predicted Rdx family selenoprotein
LVLAREGKGRVAMLLSDQIWLWARSYEGGGPHLDLLRRLSHWLMKQPELEEEALRLIVHGHDITVQRQTMADTVNEVTLTSPTGARSTIILKSVEPGLWRTALTAKELGLWRATDGKLTALANVGPANPREFAEVTSTTDVLSKLIEATGGSTRRLMSGNSLNIPRVVPVRTSTTFRGDDWIGLKMRDVSVVRGIGVLPIFAGLIGLLLLVGSLAATWAREGR